MTVVQIEAGYPSGAGRRHRTVTVTLVDGGAGGAAAGRVIADTERVTLDGDGYAEVDLVPSSQISPPGSFYRLVVEGSQPSVVRHITVPDSGPVAWADPAIQVETPTPPSFVNVVAETVAEAGPQIAQDAADTAVGQLPEIAAGWGVALDTSTPGLLRLHRRPLRSVPQEHSGVGAASLMASPVVLPGAWAIQGWAPITLSLAGFTSGRPGGTSTLIIEIQVDGDPIYSWPLTVPAGASQIPWMVQVIGAVGDFIGMARFLGGSGRVDLGGASPQSITSTPAAVFWTPGDDVSLDVVATHSHAPQVTAMSAVSVDIGAL